MTTSFAQGGWTAACPLSRLQPQLGAAVLLPDGSQVVLFRLSDSSVRAVGNIDPIGRAAVLSRGIVGDRGGVPVVQSPLKKQAVQPNRWSLPGCEWRAGSVVRHSRRR